MGKYNHFKNMDMIEERERETAELTQLEHD